MSREDRTESIRDLLDGLLDPEEEARVRERIARDPAWARAHRREGALQALLETPLDVEPPPGMVSFVLDRIAAERQRRASRFRLPALLENVFVISGVGALAAFVAVISQVAGAGGVGWLAPATVVSARFVSRGAEAVGELAASAARLDWVARLLATLSDAARTVVETTAPPLLAITLVALACTLGFAWALVRSGKAREGALSHVHVAV